VELVLERTSLPRVLVITPCSSRLILTQGARLASHLQLTGFPITVLSRARSGWGRLVDVTVRGSMLAGSHDVILVNVYAHRAFVYESAAILAAWCWNKPCVVLLHNGDMPNFVTKWRRFSRWVLSFPNVVLVPHAFLAETLTARGFRVDGIVPNFIDLASFTFRERAALRPRFVYLRGMYSYCNPCMVIRALDIIQRRYPDASLTLVGPEGEHSRSSRELVRSLGLQHVQFRGQLPHPEIPGLAADHDIHLHANRVDNMPVSIIEMWACGLPTVGTRVGGMPYLMRDGEDGMLVASDDHQAMAAACLKLLEDAEVARTLSRNGRARAETFTWEQVRPLWINILRGEGLTANLRGSIDRK
jgi:L-malate glycosyltransferase